MVSSIQEYLPRSTEQIMKCAEIVVIGKVMLFSEKKNVTIRFNDWFEGPSRFRKVGKTSRNNSALMAALRRRLLDEMDRHQGE